jgi:CheY-like chemotaxis protein
MHGASPRRRDSDCRRRLSRQSGGGCRQYNASQGYRVFFAENTLWHSLFGLLFWEELFEFHLLHSSFDWVPHCLRDRSFERKFAAQINDKLDAIRSGSAFNLLLRPIAEKWGRPNGIFTWDRVDVDALRLRREKSIELVLTHHAMPRMTGFQLIEQVQKGWPNLPVILATGRWPCASRLWPVDRDPVIYLFDVGSWPLGRK